MRMFPISLLLSCLVASCAAPEVPTFPERASWRSVARTFEGESVIETKTAFATRGERWFLLVVPGDLASEEAPQEGGSYAVLFDGERYYTSAPEGAADVASHDPRVALRDLWARLGAARYRGRAQVDDGAAYWYTLVEDDGAVEIDVWVDVSTGGPRRVRARLGERTIDELYLPWPDEKISPELFDPDWFEAESGGVTLPAES